MAKVELDYMEYATNGAAQTAYVTNGASVVDQSYSESNRNENIALRYYNFNNSHVAQTFTPAKTGGLTSCKFYIQQSGSITAGKKIWVEVYATSSGTPTGSPLATSGLVEASGIGASLALQEFTFSTPVVLTAGTTYAIALTGDYDYDPGLNNFIYIGFDSSGEYSGGEAFWYTTSWGQWSSGYDACFYTYILSLQSYSEATIKTEGSYSLKGIATTDALNKTLTRTI